MQTQDMISSHPTYRLCISFASLSVSKISGVKIDNTAIIDMLLSLRMALAVVLIDAGLTCINLSGGRGELLGSEELTLF